MEEKFDVIVVGGGPAGMFAAGIAGRRGKRTALIEKNYQLGRKLLISGKGRCNLTNVAGIDDFLAKFSPSGKFLRNAFAVFFNDDLVNFFESRSLKLKVERGARVFPSCDDSAPVLRILKDFLGESQVKIIYKEALKDVIVKEGKVKGCVCESGKRYNADAVILATGGLSYPQTGSTGEGLKIAQRLGHTIIKPQPALVPLRTKMDFIKDWQGVSLKNVLCSILKEGKIIFSHFGEMLFTHFGVSGPIILDMSPDIPFEDKKRIFLSIDFKPALDREKLDKRLLREFSGNSKQLKNIMLSLLPRGLIKGFLEYAGIDGRKSGNQISKEERICLIRCLKDFRIEVLGTRSIKEALITKGGVCTEEINPKTMGSRIIKGLFFAGEIIDVDAKSGGFNMQAAFSTGYVAGSNV